MAESPSHKFGQLIGNLLEHLIHIELSKFCTQHSLYLDVEGKRPGVRTGKKVRWFDEFGNGHNLDFVIERTSSASAKGRPVAFIEAAWRRYTKHSKNKAQEIQGAVLPITSNLRRDVPFKGAIIAGEFTEPALEQLKSSGFSVLFMPYSTIVEVLGSFGLDAEFDESTPDGDYLATNKLLEELNCADRALLCEAIVRSNSSEWRSFLNELERHVRRSLKSVSVTPLFGSEIPFHSFEDAIQFLNTSITDAASGDFLGYEVRARFNNGNTIDGRFAEKGEALKFLEYLKDNELN